MNIIYVDFRRKVRIAAPEIIAMYEEWFEEGRL